MDAKTSKQLCEVLIVKYVDSASSAASAFTEAVIGVIDHALAYDECSLVKALGDKAKVYSSSKQVSAFNMLVRLSVPFDLKTGKKKADKAEQARANWSKFKSQLAGDDAISLTEWYESIRGNDTDKDAAKAEREAKKRAKIFEEELAARRLADPVFNMTMQVEAQLRKAYNDNPAQAASMVEGFVNKLANAIGQRIKQAIDDAA